MDSYYYFLLTVFSVIVWLMIVDKNVADYFLLVFKMMGVNTRRFLWMIRFHPKNPITNFIMARKYEQLAKELQRELVKEK